MPKRFGDLWEKFISDENIILAWNLTRKHRNKRDDIVEFKKNLEENLKNIKNELENGEYKTSPYRKKPLYEYGKCRMAYTLPVKDRIVHHMLINVIEDIFTPCFITDTYGCIKGRGQLKGSLRLREFINKYNWCLQTDIHHFYPTIDQNILYKEICKKIKDDRLLGVIKDIVYSFRGGKNCPIGNLTSQLFGNIYLNKLDKFIKHKLKIRAFDRYCDDCIILSNNKKELAIIQRQIREFVKTELLQELSYSEIYPTKQGIDFLGYRHFKGYTILRKSTALRIRRGINKIRNGKDKRKFKTKFSVIMSYRGHIKHCYSHNFQRAIGLNSLIRDLTIKEFKEVGAKPELPLTGRKVSILTMFDKDIIITAWKPCKVDKEEAIKIQFVEVEQNDELLITFTRSRVIRKQLEDTKEYPIRARFKQEGNAWYID